MQIIFSIFCRFLTFVCIFELLCWHDTTFTERISCLGFKVYQFKVCQLKHFFCVFSLLKIESVSNLTVSAQTKIVVILLTYLAIVSPTAVKSVIKQKKVDITVCFCYWTFFVIFKRSHARLKKQTIYFNIRYFDMIKSAFRHKLLCSSRYLHSVTRTLPEFQESALQNTSFPEKNRIYHRSPDVFTGARQDCRSLAEEH